MAFTMKGRVCMRCAVQHQGRVTHASEQLRVVLKEAKADGTQEAIKTFQTLCLQCAEADRAQGATVFTDQEYLEYKAGRRVEQALLDKARPFRRAAREGLRKASVFSVPTLDADEVIQWQGGLPKGKKGGFEF